MVAVAHAQVGVEVVHLCRMGMAGNKDHIDDGDNDGDDGGGGVVDHHAGALVGELCPLHRPQAPLILSINNVDIHTSCKIYILL